MLSLVNFAATCLELNEIAKTSYAKPKFLQKSFKALYSSSSHFEFIINSSKTKTVLSSITLLEWLKAQKVDEYKSASKFINDAKDLSLEKTVIYFGIYFHLILKVCHI